MPRAGLEAGRERAGLGAGSAGSRAEHSSMPSIASPGDRDWVRVSWMVSVAVPPWGTLTRVARGFSVPQGQWQPGFGLAGCSGHRAVSQPAARWLLRVLELLCTSHEPESAGGRWHPRTPLRDPIPPAPRPVAVGGGQQEAELPRRGGGAGVGEAQLPTHTEHRPVGEAQLPTLRGLTRSPSRRPQAATPAQPA